MRVRSFLIMAVILAGVTACGEEGSTGSIVVPPELAIRATIGAGEAWATAIGLVPGGKLVSGELEEEDGLLVYSFDITVPGQSGVEEIHVDALTGRVASQEHETSEQEADEAEEGR